VHKVQSILNSFKSALLPLISDGIVKTVQGNNAQSPEAHPALVIRMGAEQVQARNLSNFTNNSVLVDVDIYVHSKTLDLDEQLLAVREEVEKAIQADVLLGLPFVLNTQFEGQESPEHQGDAELYAASLRLNFTVQYRTQIG